MKEKPRQNNRKSGLIGLNPDLKEYEREKEAKLIEIEDASDSFYSLKQEYDNFKVGAIEKKRKKAYVVTFSDDSNICFITFAKSRDKARGDAIMYFREFHPEFNNGLWKQKFLKARRKRVPAFDRYAELGKVPILELLKRGMEFSCGGCGKDKFTYGDVQIGRCHVIEDGFEMNPFTQGFLLCHNCYKRFFKEKE